MTLSFSLQINDKPTHFVDKIIIGLANHNIINKQQAIECINAYELQGYQFETELYPKIHSIRKDKFNRWKAGNDMHLVINNRRPNRFQFAPIVPCISVQEIEIKNMFSDHNAVFIDGLRQTRRQIDQLAKNDGFDSTDDFWQYFDYRDVKEKLIHWTNHKY